MILREMTAVAVELFLQHTLHLPRAIDDLHQIQALPHQFDRVLPSSFILFSEAASVFQQLLLVRAA
jgi:hypothetical protein